MSGKPRGGMDVLLEVGDRKGSSLVRLAAIKANLMPQRNSIQFFSLWPLRGFFPYEAERSF